MLILKFKKDVVEHLYLFQLLCFQDLSFSISDLHFFIEFKIFPNLKEWRHQ